MTEPWVSVDDAAYLLRAAKATTCRWIETRRLPEYGVGRLWKFRVDEWIRRGGVVDSDASDEGSRR
jgi:excisionase family DNA binding protein